MKQYDPEETKRKIAELKEKHDYLQVKRRIEMEQEENRRAGRAWFDALFPEFKDIPIVWLIIVLGCVLFGIFTLII